MGELLQEAFSLRGRRWQLGQAARRKLFVEKGWGRKEMGMAGMVGIQVGQVGAVLVG